MQMSPPAPKQVVGEVCEWSVYTECSGMIGDERIQMSVGETPQCANDSHASLPAARQTRHLVTYGPCRLRMVPL